MAMLEQVRGQMEMARNGARDTTRRRDSGTATDSARRAQFIAARRQAGGGGGGPGGPGGPGGQGRPGAGTPRPNDMVTLWYVDKDGKLNATRVRTGLSDGQKTEVRGQGITEGMQVIVAVTQADEPGGSGSPFQAQRQGGFRPGGF